MRRLVLALVAVAVLCTPALAALASVSAVDDHVQADGHTLQIYVLANDSGSDLDPSTLSIVSPPTKGSAVVIAHGSPRIKYTVGGPGTDVLRYSICDTEGACATATVTVTVPQPTTTAPSTTTTTAPSTTTTTAPSTSTTVEDIPNSPPTTATTTPATPPPSTPADGEPADTDRDENAAAPTQAPPSVPPAPLLDPLSERLLTSGTPTGTRSAIGDSTRTGFDQAAAYLESSGRQTLSLIAPPTLMVSGIVGFLMVGLPRDVLSMALGLLVGAGRRKKRSQANAAESADD